MFELSFCWKDYLPQINHIAEVRMDKAEMSNRVSFSGIIGKAEQTPAELHADAVSRKDFGELAFTKDSNGRLKGRAVITTTGVYPYLNKDGSVKWELRHPDDVYDPESLKTLELLPLTNDHPTDMVTPETVKDLQVGQLGESVWVDMMHGTITNTVVISENQAIADTESGKRAVSAGYSSDVIPEEGNWNGTPYTHRQTNIRYNHCSIVGRGRAGDAAKMKFDHFDGFQVDESLPEAINTVAVVKTDNKDIGEEDNMPGETKLDLRTVKLDGVDRQAEPAVLTALHNATVKADSIDEMTATIEQLNKDKTALEGERDSLKAKNDKLSEELEATIKVDELEGLFASRKKLDEAVELAEIEGADVMDVATKMEAVVLKADSEAKSVLDLKRDSSDFMVYLGARFDAAVGDLKKDQDTLSQNLSAGTGANSSSVRTDSAPATRKDTVLNAWKTHKTIAGGK